MKRLAGKGIWAALALLYGACAWGQSNPGLNNPAGVPGYTTNSPSETGYYADGNMSGAAASRATSGTGMDTEAAKFVTGSAVKRAQIPTTRASDWLGQAESTQKSADTMIQMIKGSYSGCTGGNITDGASVKEYVYGCRGPTGVVKHYCDKTLEPECIDKFKVCFEVKSKEGFLDNHYGTTGQYLYLGSGHVYWPGFAQQRGIHSSGTHTATATVQIDDIRDISKVMLDFFAYEDYAELKINGSVVHSDLSAYSPSNTSARYMGVIFWIHGGAYSYQRRNHNFDREVTSYFKTGTNTIEATVRTVGSGGITFRLVVDTLCCTSSNPADCCKKWRDVWKDGCK